jgi:large subunit ribosomal protein L25
MAEILLKAQTGRTTGSRSSGRLRADGKVPAVVYGLGHDAQSVTVDWRELRAVLTTDAALNVLVDLEIEGQTDLVMIKDLQRHAVRRNVLHVDFLRVSRDVAIEVEVPINIEGEAIAVQQEGGLVEHLLFALTVSAKPADIPNEILVDVTDLRMGGVIRVSDLALPAGVVTDVDPEEIVIVAGAGSREELPPEPAEGEEVEGAEGEGGDAPSGSSDES